MILYDPNIIHQHAQKLYDQARTIVVLYGVFGAIVGLGFGLYIGETTDSQGVMALLMAILFGALGALVGKKRSFELLLRAQVALCQVQIELNGRRHTTQATQPVAS